MTAAATVAAIVSGVAAAGSLGYGIYAGQKQQAAQQQALVRQNQAQQQAQVTQLNSERQSQIAQNDANRQTPNVATILQKAMQMGNAGIASTMLTQPGAAGGQPLGKTTLLGS